MKKFSLCLLLLFLISCSTEQLVTTNEITTPQPLFRSKDVSLSEIRQNEKISSKLQKVTGKANEEDIRYIFLEKLNLTVRIDFARYIETEHYNSYTFSTVQGDDENIKNILFTLNENGEYDSFLLEYEFSKNDLKKFDIENPPFGRIKSKPLELTLNSLTSKLEATFICVSSYRYVTQNGDLGRDFIWDLTASSCYVAYEVNYDEPDQWHEDYNSGIATYTTGGSISGGSGGIGTSPTVSLYDEPELIKLNVVKNQLKIRGIPKNSFIDKNPSITFGLYDYLTENAYTAEAKDFSNWALDFLMANPTVTWTTFQNWFMGKSEGQDGEYFDTDLIEYETPIVQQSLPSFSSWMSHFPKIEENGYWKTLKSSEVYKLVGGSLYNNHLNDLTGIYQNACAIRGSRALLYSNIEIPIIKNGSTQLTQKGGDDKNYILSATTFLKFMMDTFGDTIYKLEGVDANDSQKVSDFLKGKNGIYIIENKQPGTAGYSGHVDSIIDGKCITGSLTKPKGGVKSIRIWILN